MANGLFCPESLPVTPKLRHDSTDSNSENQPPELGSSLLCREVLQLPYLEEKELQRNPACLQQQPLQHRQQPPQFHHPPVESHNDHILLRDDRVLQNLLRNEERYLPGYPDYFKYVQVEVKPHMRQIVAKWMFEVCCEYDVCPNTPEVFILAMNFMDRFLAVCRISKNQLQLLGAACLFLASKFKAVDHISSEKLVMYTDYSITTQELKDWELLILHKLRWELCSTTAMDYLDHLLPRLALPSATDVPQLRRKTETIITHAAQDYFFSYRPASLLAAAAILYSVQGEAEQVGREVTTCLQILTAGTAAGSDLRQCCSHLADTLPPHLAPARPSPPSPDTTATSPARSNTLLSTRTSTPSTRQSAHPDFTAVDVFSDFNSSVLQAVLSPQTEPYSSILVT